MKSRGNHSYIDTFDGRPFDNPWSACAADVCPVGALTVREFRFRARVWHLEETPTVCPGCSIGCNVNAGHLNGEIHRFVPRPNAEINGWWMCDYGRFLAEGLGQRSIDVPLERIGERTRPVTWDTALTDISDWLQREADPLVIASANFSNETLFVIRRHLVERMKADVIVPVHRGAPRRIKDGRGRWNQSTDAHPNSTGARHLGLATIGETELEGALRNGRSPILILDADAHPWLSTQDAAVAVRDRNVAVLARNRSPLVDAARIVLPVASWLESEGTFTSSTGRVQLARRAFTPKVQARPAWEVVHRLAVALDIEQQRGISPRVYFTEMAAEVGAFSGMTWGRLATEPGIPVHDEVHRVG